MCTWYSYYSPHTVLPAIKIFFLVMILTCIILFQIYQLIITMNSRACCLVHTLCFLLKSTMMYGSFLYSYSITQVCFLTLLIIVMLSFKDIMRSPTTSQILAFRCPRSRKLKTFREEWDYCLNFLFVKILDFLKDIWNFEISKW